MNKKGFKVLGMNMEAIKGDGMVYELYKEYTFDGDIRCGECGYHYFESLRDCMMMYNLKESRVFECEVLGEYKDDDYIHCTNIIKLTRELTQDEIKRYIEDNLDILINDNDWCARREVARQGYGLDKLINDTNYIVRKEVAHQGYGLDILINDSNVHVRKEVARQGYGLDTLINDIDWHVRCEVARQGYGLDTLINDSDLYVRREAQKQLQYKKTI